VDVDVPTSSIYSATTSTQSFFLLNFASDSPIVYEKEAFENWTWPWLDIQNLGKKAPSDKILSMLVTKRHTPRRGTQ
jgi:hypothetical protein